MVGLPLAPKILCVSVVHFVSPVPFASLLALFLHPSKARSVVRLADSQRDDQ